MKKRLLILAAYFLIITIGFAQQKSAQQNHSKPEDSIEQYWFVILKSGPNTTADSTSSAILFEKHLANIKKLYYDGIIKVSGPFGKNDNDWRGIFIIDCATREDTERILQSDPAIAAGLLSVEITPWYTAPIGSFKKGKPVKSN